MVYAQKTEIIDDTQQNSKCILFGNRDKTINYIISKYSKGGQREYKSRHDWVGNVIHRKFCKKLKFNHTTKSYTHKLKSVLEIKTYKILWSFEIQTDYLISARIPDLEIINKTKKREPAQ